MGFINFIAQAAIDCQIHNAIQPTTSMLYEYYPDIHRPDPRYLRQILSEDELNTVKPTPTQELDSFLSSNFEQVPSSYGKLNYLRTQVNIDSPYGSISPARVLHHIHQPDSLYSPIFNFPPIEDGTNLVSRAQDAQYLPQNLLDSNNGLDLLEQGSGWDMFTFGDPSNIMEESNSLTDYEPTQSMIMPTFVMTPEFVQQTTSSLADKYDRPPVLNRRLPKLAVTAGQVWRYFIPYDTFFDEQDGNLKYLKTMIYLKKPGDIGNINKPETNLNDSYQQESIDQYYSWLQYDPNSLLLYGFPTDNDAGKHEFVLMVSDRWGSTNNETIEINVRQHPSTRAFTHLFVINNIYWDRQKYPSMIDALGKFINRISTRLYFDQPFRNFIVHYYTVNNNQTENNYIDPNRIVETMQTDQPKMSFSIAWSNGSAPVHPCNLSYLEELSRYLIDVQDSKPDWSLDRGEKLELTPSQNLIKALEPEFTPTSVSIHLQGACESRETLQMNNVQDNDNVNSAPRVRIKIGKLTWKLGEPIEYQIPTETFGAVKGVYTTRDLQLNLHTIDGLTLDKDPKYSFLEFDQENQTLYGLSYSQAEHVGQKELQLTARHLKSGQKVREVFIINIESQDLTAINNRAFRMSLYLMARTGLFGPKERVSLSHKIIGALKSDSPEIFHHDKDIPELAVLEIQKFSMDPFYLKNNSSISIPSNSNGFQNSLIKVIDNAYEQSVNYLMSGDPKVEETNFLYKFTWTNSTIGYRGDCPVEVIKENILYALEKSMIDLNLPDEFEDVSKNDTVRFYERLRLYFEPDSDLIHLRFEPLGACLSALKLHDVGDSDFADLVDRAGDLRAESSQEVSTPDSVMIGSPKAPEEDIYNDEYWFIIVLILLVVVLIFVIVMFFMGMHTYKINQDKRFELQVRLAQARQNSMFLSSMILTNQATPNDICSQMIAPEATKTMYVVQDEEKGSRKPVILDNEEQLFVSRLHGPTPMIDQFGRPKVHMNPNRTLTLDSIASWRPSITTVNLSSSGMPNNLIDDKQRSVTLHRRPNNSMQRMMSQQSSMNNLNFAQHKMAVLGTLSAIPQGAMPVFYNNGLNQSEPVDQSLQMFSLVKNTQSMANGFSQTVQPTYQASNIFVDEQSPQDRGYPNKIQMNNGTNGVHQHSKVRSPSYSSSTSATQSVRSNPNYVLVNREYH